VVTIRGGRKPVSADSPEDAADIVSALTAHPNLLVAAQLLVGALDGFGVDEDHPRAPMGFTHAVISAGKAARAGLAKAYALTLAKEAKEAKRP
jgi:hypothetical protein